MKRITLRWFVVFCVLVLFPADVQLVIEEEGSYYGHPTKSAGSMNLDSGAEKSFVDMGTQLEYGKVHSIHIRVHPGLSSAQLVPIYLQVWRLIAPSKTGSGPQLKLKWQHLYELKQGADKEYVYELTSELVVDENDYIGFTNTADQCPVSASYSADTIIKLRVYNEEEPLSVGTTYQFDSESLPNYFRYGVTLKPVTLLPSENFHGHDVTRSSGVILSGTGQNAWIDGKVVLSDGLLKQIQIYTALVPGWSAQDPAELTFLLWDPVRSGPGSPITGASLVWKKDIKLVNGANQRYDIPVVEPVMVKEHYLLGIGFNTDPAYLTYKFGSQDQVYRCVNCYTDQSQVHQGETYEIDKLAFPYMFAFGIIVEKDTSEADKDTSEADKETTTALTNAGTTKVTSGVVALSEHSMFITVFVISASVLGCRRRN